MQAIDTNILIYAEVESSHRHGVALELLKSLAEGSLPWAIRGRASTNSCALPRILGCFTRPSRWRRLSMI